MFKPKSEDFIYIEELQWGSESIKLSLSHSLAFLRFSSLLVGIDKTRSVTKRYDGEKPKFLLNDRDWGFKSQSFLNTYTYMCVYTYIYTHMYNFFS